MEAADAGIKVIVAITEGIPVADMVCIDGRDCTLIGPNCIITAGQAKVGIMPGFIFEPGVVGIVYVLARSRTKRWTSAPKLVQRPSALAATPSLTTLDLVKAYGGRRDQGHRDDRGNRRRPRGSGRAWIQENGTASCFIEGVDGPSHGPRGHCRAGRVGRSGVMRERGTDAAPRWPRSSAGAIRPCVWLF